MISWKKSKMRDERNVHYAFLCSGVIGQVWTACCSRNNLGLAWRCCLLRSCDVKGCCISFQRGSIRWVIILVRLGTGTCIAWDTCQAHLRWCSSKSAGLWFEHGSLFELEMRTSSIRTLYFLPGQCIFIPTVSSNFFEIAKFRQQQKVGRFRLSYAVLILCKWLL